MKKGKFITFEGGEGCGKSTQVALLKAALEDRGIEVVQTREPGGTWLSERVRTLIKDQSEDVPCDRCELLLFLAARAQLVEKVIRPALDDGKWVVSDRFSDSTVAYQGYGRGLPISIIEMANDFACHGIAPDLTLLMKVDAEEAARRMLQREKATHTDADRIELAGTEFHSRLSRGFDELAKKHPERIAIIDANGSKDMVWEKIWKLMQRFL